MNTEQERLNIGLWELHPSRFQPRAPQFDADGLLELAQSIKDNGLINPVLVFSYDDADGYVVWELIAGERRTRACVALRLAELFTQHSLADWAARLANVGLRGIGDEERDALRKANATIPATVHPGNDLQAIHVLAVIENLDRQELGPLEEARAYKSLTDAYGWKQRELAARLNKSQGYVAQRMGLLGLNETAAQALNTRVIGMSHARALAVVPEALQAVATEYVIAEVQKDESPATTRQIEHQLRALTAFVDPARWEPNGERVYTPQARNRLAVIRMLVSGPHAVERIAKGWGHLRLFNDGYETKNLLTAKPLTLVESDRLYIAVTNALGLRPQDAWQQHAHLESKACATCLFSIGTVARRFTPGLPAHCPRWKDATLHTCEHWISAAFGPVIIPTQDYYLKEQLKAQQALIGEPFPHTYLLEAYLSAYDAGTLELAEQATQKEDRAINGPRQAIAEFWEWQKALPREALRHSQTHACVACRYFEPLNGDAPCRFALNPLPSQYGMSDTRAPQHGILCSPTLMQLPRCEMFTRQHLPPIYRQPGFSVGIAKAPRNSVLSWMKAIKGDFNSLTFRARAFLWRGPFAWLYAGGDGKSYSWDDIEAHLRRSWEEIGDGGMATLLNALVLEVQAGKSYKGPIELLDLETGQAEAWMPLVFHERREEQRDWPEGWMRPWEITTDGEMDDRSAGL